MRLVVEWTSSDGCTYSCQNTVPVEYESAEKFIVDFDNTIKAQVASTEMYRFKTFTLGGHEFDGGDFVEGERPNYDVFHITLPDVMTVDEWFAKIR